MEVINMPAVAISLNFNNESSASSSPFMTAPSSPQRFGDGNFYFSAPASPIRMSSTYEHHASLANNDLDHHDQSCAVDHHSYDDGGFEFSFSGPLSERASISADELFHGGKIKIKPLKPPHSNIDSTSISSTSNINESFKRGEKQTQEANHEQQKQQQQRAGRQRSSNKSRRLGTRSLSPLRVSDIMFDDAVQEENNFNSSTSTSYVARFLSAISFKNYKKWKLKNLLFRSASEGSAQDLRKSPVIETSKYAVLYRKEDSRITSSFQSTEGSVGGSNSSRRSSSSHLSAHEIHYTVNRAVSKEMRRRTFLPYKHGLWGCLGFNPSLHEISRGSLGSLARRS